MADTPPPYLSPKAQAAARALQAVRDNSSPKQVYDAFNAFCKTHFGAESDPLIYEHFGHALEFEDSGAWQHVSENSASLAWESNLPAVSYVEYGPTTRYGRRTEPTDRHYYLHLHQLTGLRVGQTYHYRVVLVDERGNQITSPDQTLTTQRVEHAIRFPEPGARPPYRLDRAGATYILTSDITAPGAAIVTLADDITLDLNGHTVTFGERAEDSQDVVGVMAGGTQSSATSYQTSNLRVLNGTIQQGNGPAMAANTDSLRLSPIQIAGGDIELAGLNIIYHAPQTWGTQLNHARGDIRIHHNVYKDMGAKITNRHGTAVRTIGFRFAKDSPNNFTIHHNLIKRTRQNGIGQAHHMHNNEVYVDSWSINSFAIQPESKPDVPAGKHHHNRVFGTGFNAFGFGWAHEDLTVDHNLIHFHGYDFKHRWHERWGDVNLLQGLRVTNYGQGGQVRNNLRYHDNLIIVRGSQDAELRGTGFFSDETIQGLVFENNTVKAQSLDAATSRVACVAAHGHYRKADTLPVYYRNSRLISNVALVRFGDAYGKGNHHVFEGCTFVRDGDRKGFHTFVFDGSFYNRDHQIIDATFENGAAVDDVFWHQTSSLSDYSVRWTLSVKTSPGAAVTVVDREGVVEFDGKADSDGLLRTALTEYDVRPNEWQADYAEQMRGVVLKDQHQKITRTPHTITVEVNGIRTVLEVEMSEPREVEIR